MGSSYICKINRFQSNFMQIPQISPLGQLGSQHTLAILRKGDQLFALEDGVLAAELYAQIAGSSQVFEARSLKGIETTVGAAERFFMPLDQSKGLDHSEHLRISAAKILRHAATRKTEELCFAFSSIQIDELGALIDGIFFAQYEFLLYKSQPEPKTWPSLRIFLPAEQIETAQQIVAQKLILAEATSLSRDFVNTPGGDLVPSDYAERITQAFDGLKDVSISVMDEQELEEQGFMGLITVGRGSQNPPRMVTIEYTPAGASENSHLGFVGKGMTFDAGGISIKPAAGMWEMRMDMAGSAAVVGAMLSIVKLALPIRVTAVLCLAENRPGENACLPGDIFKAKNGKTIMVDNTDAEGRLILSDGLAKVGASGATTILDLATLTGAIIRAIGTSIAGLFANDDDLAGDIIASGRVHGEKLWQMPLDAEYRDALDDKVADMKNVGGDAGAITAGLFLQEFVPENAKWAHLDIAGTAFTTKDWKYYGSGGTGWGVRTLVELATKYSGGQA